MEKLINRCLDLSSHVNYYYELSLEDKMDIFNLCVSIERLNPFYNFMYEHINLSEFIYAITKDKNVPGRRSPDKKYLIDKKKKTYAFKGMSKKEYHIERKKIYQQIEDLKYMGSYRKKINEFLIHFEGSNDMRFKLFEELKRIDNYIDKNKNLGL
jgi:hypothetical protein